MPTHLEGRAPGHERRGGALRRCTCGESQSSSRLHCCPLPLKTKRGSHVMPNVGWTRVCDLAAPRLQEHRQASGPLCPAPGAVGRSSGGTWSPCPTPPSRCAHPCSCRQLNLWEEGTHLAPLRGNYNLLPTSSSDRLRLVCPLALRHLFTTSRDLKPSGSHGRRGW